MGPASTEGGIRVFCDELTPWCRGLVDVESCGLELDPDELVLACLERRRFAASLRCIP